MGVAIIMTLMVLTILMVIVFAIGAQGIWNLTFMTRENGNRMAFCAAESGLNEQLLMYRRGTTGWNSNRGSITNPLGPFSNGAYYRVEVFDNSSGGNTMYNGVNVPAATIYFCGWGYYQRSSFSDFNVKRRIVVLVDPQIADAYNYAIASAGPIDLKQIDIVGNIKCDGDLKIQSTTTMGPANHQGNMLVGGQILNGSSQIKFNGFAAGDQYECHAIYGVETVGKIVDEQNNLQAPYWNAPKTTVVDSDARLKAFSNTGATAPGTDSSGKVNLPNPDFSTVMAKVSQTIYSTDYSGNLGNPSGSIYYFPNGVNFTGKIVGNCSIVAGKAGAPGNIIFAPTGTFDQYITNVIALDGANGTAPTNATIKISASKLSGLVYCHGPITTQGCLVDAGSVISYKGGITGLDTNASANCYFKNDNIKNAPGFENWFRVGGAGSGTVNIMSWQRM
jgi:hypothetical protein